VSKTGLPAILKTRRLGYDGKGQAVLRTPADLDHAWVSLSHNTQSASLILEALVPFERELSILSVRSRTGEMRFYPLVENVHASGILRRSLAPAPPFAAEALASIQKTAERYARAVAERLDYVGVLALELFQIGDRLIVNEMAPR